MSPGAVDRSAATTSVHLEAVYAEGLAGLENARALLTHLGAVIVAQERQIEQLRGDNATLTAEQEQWQEASGLCAPSEERGGDSGNVRPRHLEGHLRDLRGALAPFAAMARRVLDNVAAQRIKLKPGEELWARFSRGGGTWEITYEDLQRAAAAVDEAKP